MNRAAARARKASGMPHMQVRGNATQKDDNPLLTPDVLAYIEKVESGDNTIKLFDVEEECRTIREGIAKSEMVF